MTLLYPSKFESLDASLSYTFGLENMEAQFEQAMRSPLSIGVGSDYAHDHLGYGIAPRSAGSIRIRQTIVETTEALVEAKLHEARAECLRIGKGWLYRTNQDATSHRCLARINSMPSYQRGGFQSLHMPLIFDFTQLSDWQATSATTGSQTLTAYQTFVTITNAGNLPVRAGIVFSLTAITAAGWTNPEIRNMTTGEAVSTTRDSARIGDIWRVGDPDFKVGYGAPAMVVGKSGRSVGAALVGPQTYFNDFSRVTVTKAFPSLNPGANEIRIQIDGTPSATFAYSFYGRFS